MLGVCEAVGALNQPFTQMPTCPNYGGFYMKLSYTHSIVMILVLLMIGCAEVDREDLDILREDFQSEINSLRDERPNLADEISTLRGEQSDLRRDVEGAIFKSRMAIEDQIFTFRDDVDNRFTPFEESLGSGGPFVSRVPDRVTITEIGVTNEYEFGRLEIEVHIYDRADNFIACSGQINGLEHVDGSDRLYSVGAFFNKSDGGYLTYDDLQDKVIYLVVIEDDSLPCPEPGGVGFPFSDDFVGKTETFRGQDIAGTKAMQFDDVTRLTVTVSLTWKPINDNRSKF